MQFGVYASLLQHPFFPSFSYAIGRTLLSMLSLMIRCHSSRQGRPKTVQSFQGGNSTLNTGPGGVFYFCPLLKSGGRGNMFFVLWLYLSRSLMILQLTSWTVSWMVRDLELHWSSTGRESSVSHAICLPLSQVPDEDSMEPFLLMAKQAPASCNLTMLWFLTMNGVDTGAGKSHTMTGPTDGPVELQGAVLGGMIFEVLRKVQGI